ncbi:MAG: hypothetical protein Q7U37_09465 [Gallionella sp.]|nr:hypothetical protein [Gallionella sp.]
MGAYIPTLGHIATAVDSYRAVAVAEVKDRPASWCFTDTDAASALGRIVDGPIVSRADIEKAEAALRAILLHDVVDIIVPTVKVTNSEGFFGYVRFDEGIRNEAAFAAFNAAPCSDYLLASELVEIRNGEIISSTNPSSLLTGNELDDRRDNYARLLSSSSEIVNAMPMQVDAAAHYSANEFTMHLKQGSAGFINSLYRRIERPWMEVAQIEPSLFIDVKLPPLIAIVLARAGHRKDIPEVLIELREELAPVRDDLARMNCLLDSTITQADLNAQVRKINESFDAIVPEALLTDAERRWRRITTAFNFVKPARQLYGIAVDPLAADPDKIAEIFQNTRQAILQNRRIVSRSVPAAKFSELLRVDSARGIVTTHFSQKELELFSAD